MNIPKGFVVVKNNGGVVAEKNYGSCGFSLAPGEEKQCLEHIAKDLHKSFSFIRIVNKHPELELSKECLAFWSGPSEAGDRQADEEEAPKRRRTRKGDK